MEHLDSLLLLYSLPVFNRLPVWGSIDQWCYLTMLMMIMMISGMMSLNFSSPFSWLFASRVSWYDDDDDNLFNILADDYRARTSWQANKQTNKQTSCFYWLWLTIWRGRDHLFTTTTILYLANDNNNNKTLHSRIWMISLFWLYEVQNI